jgi:hypothetical protein
MKELIETRQEYLGGPAVLAGPEEIQGIFDFPVRDVNLPTKPSENAQVWADVFTAAASNPLITQRIDLFWIFKQLTESLGIKNIDDARIDQMNTNFQVTPDEQILDQAQRGNVVPMPMK